MEFIGKGSEILAEELRKKQDGQDEGLLLDMTEEEEKEHNLNVLRRLGYVKEKK